MERKIKSKVALRVEFKNKLEILWDYIHLEDIIDINKIKIEEIKSQLEINKNDFDIFDIEEYKNQIYYLNEFNEYIKNKL